MSVYKFIEIVGTSQDSWEDAANTAIKTVASSVRDLRVAEVEQMDLINDGGVTFYRTKLKLSFRIERIEEQLFFKNPGAWLLEKEHTSMDG
jgi:flavin-binding protein dodecin